MTSVDTVNLSTNADASEVVHSDQVLMIAVSRRHLGEEGIRAFNDFIKRNMRVAGPFLCNTPVICCDQEAFPELAQMVAETFAPEPVDGTVRVSERIRKLSGRPKQGWKSVSVWTWVTFGLSLLLLAWVLVGLTESVIAIWGLR